jgi:hypothetical protein
MWVLNCGEADLFSAEGETAKLDFVTAQIRDFAQAV